MKPVAMLCHGTEGYGVRRVVLDLLAGIDTTQLLVIEPGPLMEDARTAGIPVAQLSLPEPFEPYRVSPSLLLRQRQALRHNAAAVVDYCRDHGIRIVHTHLLPLHIVAGMSRRLSHKQVESVWHFHVIPGQGRLGRLTRLAHNIGGLRWAGRIIAVSEATASAYRSVFRKHVRVVYNGIPQPPPLDEARAAELRQRYRHRWAHTLCWAGRLVRGKGVHVAIQALAQLARRDVGLVILGDTEDPGCQESGYLRELEELIGTHDLSSQVELAGRVDYVAEVMAASDLLVHTRLDPEPCSMVIIEALSVGLPVVATSTGGTPELVRPDFNGLLVPPGQPVALAAALDRLLSDPRRRHELSRSALSDARSRFSLERVIAQVQSVYAELGAR